MNKKHILTVGMVGSICFGLGLWFLTNDICSPEVWVKCRSIDRTIDILTSLLIFAPLIFFFSLLTYKLREEVFRVWLRFTYWWIPLSVFLVLTADAQGSLLFPSLQEVLGMFLPALYVVISLIIIAWKYVATRQVNTRA